MHSVDSQNWNAISIQTLFFASLLYQIKTNIIRCLYVQFVCKWLFLLTFRLCSITSKLYYHCAFGKYIYEALKVTQQDSRGSFAVMVYSNTIWSNGITHTNVYICFSSRFIHEKDLAFGNLWTISMNICINFCIN